VRLPGTRRASERIGGTDLYVINADGGGERRLTTNPKADLDPDRRGPH
jgi:Tol biopolymer transport system component